MTEDSQVLEDFSLEPVPLEKRRSWIELAVIWIGIAVVMSAIFRGMMIGMGLGRMQAVVVSYILGEIILIAVMALTGYIGARTGLSTPLIANLSFGRIGSVLISLSIALSLMGWFGVQAAFFARTVQFYLKTDFSLPLFSFVCGLVMMVPAIFGIRGLSVLSWIASPFMIVIFVWGIFKMGFHFLPAEALQGLAAAHQPTPYPMTLGAAASVVAGGFIVGAVTSADIFRYARPRLKEIVLAAMVAMTASAFLHFVGSFLAMNTGMYHESLPEIIIGGEYLGLGFAGFVVLLLAQWTTNDSNLYSSVLALNNIFRIKRWKMTVAAGVAASLFAALGILERLELFLVILTVSIGPIGGIFLCDFYLLKRTRRRVSGESDPGPTEISIPTESSSAGAAPEVSSDRPGSDITMPDVKRINGKALAVYVAACLIGWTTSGHPWTLPVFPFSIFAFNGILSSIALYYVVMKLFPDKA